MRQSRFFFVSFTPLPLRGISPVRGDDRGAFKAPLKNGVYGLCDDVGAVSALALTEGCSATGG